MPTRTLAWWNAFTAVLTVVPCSVVVFFPFMFSLTMEWRFQSLSRQLPEGYSIDLGEIIVPCGAAVYAGQIVILALPAAVASYLLFRHRGAGWWVSTGVLATQGTLLSTNLASLWLCGDFGRKAFGVSTGMALWGCAFFLFLVNLLLLCRAAARSRVPPAAVS